MSFCDDDMMFDVLQQSAANSKVFSSANDSVTLS